MFCQFRCNLVLVICIIVLFSSVNFVFAANPPSSIPITEYQQRFKEIVDVYTVFGKSSEQLTSRFGDPPFLKKYPVASPHESTDKSNIQIIIHYPGASFQILRVGKHINPDAEFYQEIILTGDGWSLPHGLHVGVNRSEIIRTLGKPYKVGNSLDIYTNHFEAYTNPMNANYYEGVEFFYSEEVVKKIRIVLAID